MKYVHKNNISTLLAGRRVVEVAKSIGISRQMMNYYIKGLKKPHKLRMETVLLVLGEPWGRILDESEVWPMENVNDIQNTAI
jgi:hypothetical protein